MNLLVPQGPVDDEVPTGGEVPESPIVEGLRMVATTHAVVISVLDLALSLVNALHEHAFQVNSYTNLVFAVSVAVEGFGFLFAVGMALCGGGDAGGPPLPAVSEAASDARSDEKNADVEENVVIGVVTADRRWRLWYCSSYINFLNVDSNREFEESENVDVRAGVAIA